MNLMRPPEDKAEAVSYTIEDIAEKILLWAGVVSLFVGVSGLILVITYPEMYGDEVLQFGVTFVFSYMIIVGIFLVIYHSKIIVRGYPT